MAKVKESKQHTTALLASSKSQNESLDVSQPNDSGDVEPNVSFFSNFKL